MSSEKIRIIQIILLISLTFCLEEVAKSPTKANETEFVHKFTKATQLNEENSFVFQKSVTLKDTFAEITGLQYIDTDTILIRGRNENDDEEKVKLLTGSEYQTKENELKIPLDNNQVKFVKDKILINRGSMIEEKSSTESLEFLYENRYLSQALLVTDKYVLVNEIGLCDKLIRIWLGTLKVEIIQFSSPFCSYNYNTWFMKDLKNGMIAFGGELATFVLDQETLSIIQKIDVPRGWYEDIKFYDIDSFYDTETNTSIIQLSTTISFFSYNWKQFVYKFSHETQEYEYLTQIYTSTSKFKLIGTNEAVSFKKNIASHWNNLDFLKALSFDRFYDTFFKDRYYVLVSNSEEFFIMLFNSDNSYFLEVYCMEESYEPELMFNFETDSKQNTQITSDDEFIFTMSKNAEEITTLRVFNVKTKEKVEILPNSGELFLNFQLFHSDIDKFIILLKKSNDSSLNLINSTYWIQIRKISEPSTIIKEIQLTDFPLTEQGNEDFKIVYNDNWDQQFIFYCLQNSIAVLYNIENDVLTKLIQTESNKFTSGIYASSEYLIHIDGNDSSIKVYSKDKLELIERIEEQLVGWDENESDSYALKDDKLFIKNCAYDSGELTLYDFTRERGNWYVGRLQSLYDYTRVIFFPKRQFVYYYSFHSIFEPQHPVKAVYSISFPLDKEYTIVGEDLANYVNSYLYIEKSPNRECDQVAMLDPYLNSSRLIVWKNCPPFTEYKIYPDESGRSTFSKKLVVSSDEKHLVGLFGSINDYNIQIRNIDQDFEIVKNITFSKRSSIYNVQLTKNNLLVLLYFNQLEILSLNNKTESSSFGLKSIISFDSNGNLDLFFVGENTDSTSENPIYSIFVIDSSRKTLFQKNITGDVIYFNALAIEKNGEKIAFSYKIEDSKNQLTVWDLVNNKSFEETQIEGELIKEILFLDQNEILVNIDNKITILTLTNQNEKHDSTNFMHQLKEFPVVSSYIVSKDRNLLAFVTDDYIVEIYDRFQNQVSHIKLKENETLIASLAFTSNNTLLIINNESVISTFTQSACPHGFENVNSYCLCLREHANPTSCECNENFQESLDSMCQCLDPFILNGQNCECRKNQTQVNQSCQCNENFSLKGLECLCESPFMMLQDGRCSCPLNTTQNEQQCLCKENFVKSLNSCVCPESFTFEQETCKCLSNHYIMQNECIECSIWCTECSDGGFDCIVFSWVFYCFIIGCGLILVGTIFLIVKFIRKKSNLRKDEDETLSSNNLSSKDLIDGIQKSEF